jgi:hypothetical protein
MAAFSAACNRTSWPCGCVTWYEWEPAGSGEWSCKRWQCFRHEKLSG